LTSRLTTSGAGLATWWFHFVPTPFPTEVTKKRCHMPNRNVFDSGRVFTPKRNTKVKFNMFSADEVDAVIEVLCTTKADLILSFIEHL